MKLKKNNKLLLMAVEKFRDSIVMIIHLEEFLNSCTELKSIQ